MIPIELASVAVQVAQGAIKLGGRLDRLLAEKVAVQGQLVLAQPTFSAGPSAVKMLERLRTFLEQTQDQVPDPLGRRRTALSDLLANPQDAQQVEQFYDFCFPEEGKKPDISPNTLFVQSLQGAFPSMRFEEESTRLAAFYIAAGTDERQIGYGGRLGLLLADVLLEFGGAHTALFLRDATSQQAVRAVVECFAERDLENFTVWRPLLRHAIGSTLNGLLDSGDVWGRKAEWLKVLLDVLADARASAGPAADEFLISLFEGQGYRLLIRTGLERAAAVLGEEDRQVFAQVAGEVLNAAGQIVAEENKAFLEFFAEHWGDLLHAGLTSLEKHSPALLQDQPPLVRDVLAALVRTLATTTGNNFFTSETLFTLADAAIAAVALNPEHLPPGVREEWLRDLIASIADTLRSTSLRRVFTTSGLESVVKSALGCLARHPDLLVKEPGLWQEIVGRILAAASEAPPFHAAALSTAAVEGALESIAANPALLKLRYSEILAGFAAELAALLKQRTLDQLQAIEIAKLAAQSALRNPKLFADAKNNLAMVILKAVVDAAAEDKAGLLVGAGVTSLFAKLVEAFGKYGLARVQKGPWDQLGGQLVAVLRGGLQQASEEVGVRMDAAFVPAVLARLAEAWLRTRLSTVDPKDPKFRNFFRKLIEQTPSLSITSRPGS